MIRLATTLSALTLLAACGGSQTGDAPVNSGEDTRQAEQTTTSQSLLMPLPENTSAAISGADIAARIATLADDTFEGRAPGTETGEAAALWIASEMERIGMQPAGPTDGSYLQPVAMVELTLDEGNSGLSVGVEAKTACVWTSAQMLSSGQNDKPKNPCVSKRQKWYLSAMAWLPPNMAGTIMRALM